MARLENIHRRWTLTDYVAAFVIGAATIVLVGLVQHFDAFANRNAPCDWSDGKTCAQELYP